MARGTAGEGSSGKGAFLPAIEASLSPCLPRPDRLTPDAALLLGRRFSDRPSLCAEDQAFWKYSGLRMITLDSLSPTRLNSQWASKGSAFPGPRRSETNAHPIHMLLLSLVFGLGGQMDGRTPAVLTGLHFYSRRALSKGG